MRLGPASLGSIALHALIVAVALFQWPGRSRDMVVSAVPVTIISSVVADAAPSPDAADEAVLEDLSAPAETEPTETIELTEPTPPTPEPTPQPATRPTPPEKAPARRPESQPQPSPPARTPPRRPAEAPGLDLEALAERPSDRPAAGDSGTGRAARATGPQLAEIFNQVYPHWNLAATCDSPNVEDLRVTMRVTLSSRGRITDGPTLIDPQRDPHWRAAAENAVRAMRAAEPFTVPDDFPGGSYRPVFRADIACRGL